MACRNKVRQLGDIAVNPSRLIAREQLGCGWPKGRPALIPPCLPPATFPRDCPDGGWGMSNQQLQSLSFGAIDRPACPYCGERAYLTRRSPHPDYGLRYE